MSQSEQTLERDVKGATLFEPLSFLRGPAMRNRIALSPMTSDMALPDGRITHDEVRWIGMRAKGGFGLVMTSASYVQRDGKGGAGQTGIWSDDHIEGLARLTDAIKAGSGREPAIAPRRNPRIQKVGACSGRPVGRRRNRLARAVDGRSRARYRGFCPWRKASRACRVSRHRAPRCARLSPLPVSLTPVQPAHRSLWRIAREPRPHRF